MTFARDLANFADISANNLTFRNLIINGAMQVAQRNTSVASITTENYYTADRWNFSVSSLGTYTQSVENDAPTGSGFRKSLKMLVTTADASPAASDYGLISQKIEGQNLQSILKGTSSAKQLTVSFWVKSNVTGTYIAELQDLDNTRQVSASYSISSSATWEKKTITFPADTTGAFDNDNAASLLLNFWLGSGTTYTSGTLQTTWGNTSANRAVGQTNLAAATNNYWQITGVQLEIGSSASPFEFKPINVELAQCQRYYYRMNATSSNSIYGIGHAANTTQAEIYIPLRPTLRTGPTSIDTSSLYLQFYGGATAYTPTNVTYEGSVSSPFLISLTITIGTASLTTGSIYRLLANGTSSYVGISAEL